MHQSESACTVLKASGAVVLLKSVHHLSATLLSTSTDCRQQQELIPFPLSSDWPQNPAAAASTWLKTLAAATACSSSADGDLSDALVSIARSHLVTRYFGFKKVAVSPGAGCTLAKSLRLAAIMSFGPLTSNAWHQMVLQNPLRASD